MANVLHVLLDGMIVGDVRFAENRLSFRYADSWRALADAYPLSLSLPLTSRDHGHRPIEAFIWNLLPDNERTLDRWAREFQVSARNPFALIGAVGEDCAGAVQFVTSDRLDVVLAAESPPVQWIDDSAIGERLRLVLHDASSGRTSADRGRFSLAGAQPKTALLYHDGRWGIPAGRTPTTHILKPPGLHLPGHAENEHFCLTLAAGLGFRVAQSAVRTFDGQQAIVVERYDRFATGPSIDDLIRVHQEDMCQALGVLPWNKYQSDGGPSPEAIIDRIVTHVRAPGEPADMLIAADRAAFFDAIVFNWLIGGTDAHAKNFGFLLGTDTVRLAPLYDIASAFGLVDVRIQEMRSAMKVEYYPIARILPRHFARLAARVGIDLDAAVDRIRALADGVAATVGGVGRRLREDEGLEHPVIARLEAALLERAERIAAMG